LPRYFYPSPADSAKLDPSTMERTRIEKISKALADATRLMIFCCELVALRGVTPATVSHHLKILSDVGLIECRRKGQFVHNRAVPETIAKYSRALARMAGGKKTVARR
jgi:ArsR family transcriptional regulator, arsenate/arsenite/antimonite-responsive transcriptional repressor